MNSTNFVPPPGTRNPARFDRLIEKVRPAATGPDLSSLRGPERPLTVRWGAFSGSVVGWLGMRSGSGGEIHSQDRTADSGIAPLLGLGCVGDDIRGSCAVGASCRFGGGVCFHAGYLRHRGVL